MKFFVKMFLIEAMGDKGEKGIWRGEVLFTSLSVASFLAIAS
jgi:hypothetical protein